MGRGNRISVALLLVGAVACSGSEDVASDEPVETVDVAVTIGELDGVVVTVPAEDLGGEVIVIGEDPTNTTSESDAGVDDGAVESETTDGDDSGLDLLGGDDPEDKLMPDVVCMNLQDAQDEIQDHGVFFSKSVDATGEGRRQLWDRNWIVVEQTPAAGEAIGENEAVLSVVKDDEPSDC